MFIELFIYVLSSCGIKTTVNKCLIHALKKIRQDRNHSQKEYGYMVNNFVLVSAIIYNICQVKQEISYNKQLAEKIVITNNK